MPRDSTDQLSLSPPTFVYAVILRDITGHDSDPTLFARRPAANRYVNDTLARLGAVQPCPISVTPRILRWQVH